MPAYGRNWDEQHFSPLSAINNGNVARLGLVWSYDLPAGYSHSQPVEANGVIYTATQRSASRAFEATTGKLLWEYYRNAPAASKNKLCQGFGSRGLAYYECKVFTGA